jgi:OmpA-OmpF porin, OOP family
MKCFVRRALLVCALFTAQLTIAMPSFAQDQPGSKDHPLVKRFGGSTIVGYSEKNFESVELQSSTFTQYDLQTKKRLYAKPPLQLEGKLTRIWYEAQGETSSTELFRNYVNELTASGFTTLYDSTRDAQVRKWNNFLAPFASAGTDFTKSTRSEYVFYAASDKSIRAATFQKDNTYVRLTTIEWDADHKTYKAKKGAYAAVDILETKAMTQNMVVVSAGEMSKMIASTGKVAIYGIFFDTGKADVKTESKPSLEQIAAYLKNEPNTRLHVVGHTDSVGGFDSNMGLSKRRADAIVSVLTREHGVTAARLVPNGVAHLAPVASNSSEDGRAKNRRVELVPQ